MRVNYPLIFFLLFSFVYPISGLTVSGNPLKYVAGLDPSEHQLFIENVGESKIVFSENLQSVCTVDPPVLNNSGEFLIQCFPVESTTGWMKIVPYTPENVMIVNGVQIPIQLGDQTITTPVPTPVPTMVPTPEPTTTNPDLGKPAFGMSFIYGIAIIFILVIGGGMTYYLLWVRRYD